VRSLDAAPKIVWGRLQAKDGADRSRFPALALQSDNCARAIEAPPCSRKGGGKMGKNAGIPIERQPIQRNFVVY
jgi:hypothetical protein